MASVSTAYDSLQRVLSPRSAPTSPLSPMRARGRLPSFGAASFACVETRKAVVSSTLGWWEIKKLLELEYELKGVVPPLLRGSRTLLEKDLEATSDVDGPVKIALLSDAVLVQPREGTARPRLLPASSLTVEDTTLMVSPASSYVADRIHLAPSPTLSSALARLASHIPPRPAPALSTPTWTPDSTLRLCECCTTVRFNTLTFERIHHCRACGRGICGRCSRFRSVEEGGKKERICRDCFSRALFETEGEEQE